MTLKKPVLYSLQVLFLVQVAVTFAWCANSERDSDCFVREIPLALDRDEVRIFPRPVGMRLNGNQLFIGDSKECSIKVFTLAGEHVKTIGRKGEGPGEFKFLFDFDIVADRIFVLEGSQVKILDLRGAQITGFSLQGNPYRLLVLDEGPIVTCNFPYWDSKREPLIYGHDHRGKLIWQSVSSNYSPHSAANTMQNQFLLVKGQPGEFFAIRRMNERAFRRLSRNGKELAVIAIPASVPFREIDVDFKGNTFHFSDFCQDAFWKDGELFVLLKEFDVEKKNKDTMPGREVLVFNAAGERKYSFRLPVPFKKILVAQGNVIFGIDYDNSELRKFEIVNK